MTKRTSSKPPAARGKRTTRSTSTAQSLRLAQTDHTTSAPQRKAKGEKLQKVLARAGLGSRREMETWIEAGRISVNGKRAQLGDRVDGRARLSVDGKKLETKAPERTRSILYHKPPGEVCSRKDPEGRRTVFERLPSLKGERWISIGRLDFNTSGLLLFTTDGELANALMHPSSNIEREYMVRVMGDITSKKLQHMLDGVMLDDGLARFTDIQEGGGEGVNRWYYVVLMEGRNREVRRLFESQGLTVSRLKRVRYGDVFIPAKVKQGQWVELERREVKSLYRMADLPFKEPRRGDAKQREAMERQFGKRNSPARRKKKSRRGSGAR